MLCVKFEIGYLLGRSDAFRVNALLKAIFDQKADRVRELAASQPALLSERSASGSLPFEVARSNGYIQITVALLRLSAPGSERLRDYGELLNDYFRHLSDSHACAGWLSNIEFIVWCIAVGEALPIEDVYGFLSLPADELADLRFLSERCQGWPHWDEQEERVGIVSLTRWQRLYREWYAKQRHTNA